MCTSTVRSSRLSVHSPNFIHQLLARKHLFGVGKQLEEQVKFLLGKLEKLAVRAYGEAVVIEQDAVAKLRLCSLAHLPAAAAATRSSISSISMGLTIIVRAHPKNLFLSSNVSLPSP